MSVENASVIDFVSIDKGGAVKLSISDHLDWTNEVRHLALLQEKINSYCMYVDNGQLYQDYPDARDRRVVLNLIYFHQPSAKGQGFLNKVKAVLEAEGFAFEWRKYNSDNP